MATQVPLELRDGIENDEILKPTIFSPDVSGPGVEIGLARVPPNGDMSLGGDVVGEALDARDSTAPFFEQWMSAWCRKLVIARALGKVRLPLTASARRIKVRVQNSAYEDQLPSPAWRVGRDLSRTQFEDALLAIDIFPRCALLLRIFEKMSIEDAGLLLNADKELIESATAIALNELVWNIAIGQDWSPMEATMGGPSAQIRELAA